MGKGKRTGERVTIARQDALHGLIAAGYSHAECVKILRMGDGTVCALRKKPPVDSERVEAIKRGIAGKIWRTADDANDSLTPEKLEEMSAYQLAMIQAVMIDKALLLEGKATCIINFQDVSKSIIDVDAEITELEGQIKRLEAPPDYRRIAVKEAEARAAAQASMIDDNALNT